MTEPESLPVSRFPRLSDAADIHSHPLPGIDDGAVDLETSVMMARVAARYGTSLMVATPHRWYAGGENRPDLLRRLTAQVQEAIRQTRFAHRFELIVGQEVPLTPHTADELQRGDVLTLGDTGVYVLVEPPFDRLPEWANEALAAIVQAGFQPVLAHPERNAIVQQNPALSHGFVEAGARLQLTAMSVSGDNGEVAQNAAFYMLDNDLVSVVASDAHSPTWRPPTMRRAYHLLCARYGWEKAHRLCADNPRQLARGYRG